MAVTPATACLAFGSNLKKQDKKQGNMQGSTLYEGSIQIR